MTNYASLLRDLSGALALAAENGKPDLVPVLLEKARSLDQRVDRTTTQEKGWMLRAAYELTRQRLPLNVTVNGLPSAPRAGAVRLTPTQQQLSSGDMPSPIAATPWCHSAPRRSPARLPRRCTRPRRMA